MANTKKVNIYAADGEYRVYPPVIELDGSGGNTDDIEFFNDTDEDAIFYFGPGLFDNGSFSEPVEKGKKKKTSKKAKSQGPGNRKAATYQIVLMPSGKKARGQSDPVIIVEN